MPDLQLRLSQRSENEDAAGHHKKSKYETNTMLSLSPYSTGQQEHHTDKQKGNTKTKTWPSQTTTCKPDLSLSI